MNDPLLEVLCLARAKIAKPEHWTKGANARDDDHTPCLPYSAFATCFCMEGAVIHAAHQLPRHIRHAQRIVPEALALLANHTDTNPYRYNDRPTTTHTDVLAAFDKAIADLEYHHAAPESAS